MIRTVRLLQLLVAGLVLVLAAACVPAGGDAGTVAPPPPTTAPSVEAPTHDATPGTPAPSGSPDASPSPSGGPGVSPSPSATPAGTTIVRAYFLLPGPAANLGIVPVLREVPATRAVATAALQALLDGPSASELAATPALASAVPAGTRLLGIRIEDGVAIVNLSREFESGGGSASILGRLAQVVYTLTQFPTVDGVAFELDGRPVTTFSGEGVVLDGPVSREDYQDGILPEIFVDRPAWGAAAGNPARVSGLTRVFEATFQAQLLDRNGDVLVERTVMATCGTGCWGRFDVTLEYDVATAQWGTLRVFAHSARDGAPEHIRDYPVWLTPAS